MKDQAQYKLAPNAKWIHENSAQIQMMRIDGHTDTITSCQFIYDNKQIFTVSNDNTARVWDFETGEELKCFSNLHQSIIPKGKVNNENTKFVTCSWDNSVKYWDLETGEKLWENSHSYLVTFCNFSCDHGSMIVSVSDVDFLVKIWDASTGNLKEEISGLHNNTITTVRFSLNNERIVTTSMDKTVIIYDLLTKTKTITLSGHTGIISNCCFSIDERFLATCSWDKTIRIWDIHTGQYRDNGAFILSKGHEGTISNVKVSRDGTFCISCGYDKRIILWDTHSSNPKLILKTHTDWITDIDLSKDKRFVVSVSKDKRIIVWNIEEADNVKMVVENTFKTHVKNIKCSKCGKHFVFQKIKKQGDQNMCVFCRQESILNNPTFITESTITAMDKEN